MEIICLLCPCKHKNVDIFHFRQHSNWENKHSFQQERHPSQQIRHSFQQENLFFIMNEQIYSFQYREYQISELSEPDKMLIEMAIDATRHSYAPYSEYNVGAALRLEGGDIIQGANQENASYPCGTCAERTAINYAQSTFPEAKIEVIAIAAHSSNNVLKESDAAVSETPPYPCGLCRQALAEVEHRQKAPIRVLLTTAHSVMEIPSASALLPFAFEL